MKLTIAERIKLLEILPSRGDHLDLRILRKLRDNLSFSEEERAPLTTRQHYHCPHEERSQEGRVTRCDQADFYSGPTICPVHHLEMQPGPRMTIQIPTELQHATTEVYLGARAYQICAAAIKAINDTKHLEEGPLEDLYHKFFPPDATDEPAIQQPAQEEEHHGGP